jgi:hypothetical protein
VIGEKIPPEPLTLSGAIEDLADSGFIEHFGVSEGAMRSFDSGRRFSAAELVIREYQRFEGASDPDDMSIVYGIEGQGGVRGILVDAYGAYADAEVGAFLQTVPIRADSRFGGAILGGPSHPEPSPVETYHHGMPAPVPKEPWHQEGGESGSPP